MENNQTVNLIMKNIPTDSSGKWVAVDDVRKAIYHIIHPTWDHYSDLPAPSAYQTLKNHIE